MIKILRTGAKSVSAILQNLRMSQDCARPAGLPIPISPERVREVIQSIFGKPTAIEPCIQIPLGLNPVSRIDACILEMRIAIAELNRAAAKLR